MSKKDTAANVDINDPAALADHEGDPTDEDLGNDGTVDEEEEEADEPAARKPAKKAAKKAVAKPAEGEEEESDEEEEPDEVDEEEEEEEETVEDPERAKLAKKLSRVNRARTALETQVDQLRRQLEQHTADKSEASKVRMEKLQEELDTLYDQVEEHRAKGEAKEAAKAQRRIDDIRDNMTRSQAAYTATREALRQTETRAYNTMVKELEALDPRFDQDHDDYDEDLLNDVDELVNAYEAKGVPLTEALRKAVKVTLREDIFAKGRSLAREAKKVDGKVPAGKKKTDVDKNLKTAKRQPAEEPGARRERSSDLPDMESISDEDFDKLPEATKRRLLGSDGDTY